jgi:hypothetical protein
MFKETALNGFGTIYNHKGEIIKQGIFQDDELV